MHSTLTILWPTCWSDRLPQFYMPNFPTLVSHKASNVPQWPSPSDVNNNNKSYDWWLETTLPLTLRHATRSVLPPFIYLFDSISDWYHEREFIWGIQGRVKECFSNADLQCCPLSHNFRPCPAEMILLITSEIIEPNTNLLLTQCDTWQVFYSYDQTEVQYLLNL